MNVWTSSAPGDLWQHENPGVGDRADFHVSRRAKPGDLLLLYATKLGLVALGRFDAIERPDEGWATGEATFVSVPSSPLTGQRMKADPTLKDWNALKRNFTGMNRSEPPVDPKILDRLDALLPDLKLSLFRSSGSSSRPRQQLEVAGWVVKGVPSRMSESAWAEWLRPGTTGRWYTTKTIEPVTKGMPVFFFKGSPASVLIGEGRLTGSVEVEGGQTLIGVQVVGPFSRPLRQSELRSEPVLMDASFLKQGPVGTFYPLTAAHVARIRQLSGTAAGAEATGVDSLDDAWEPSSAEDARERVQRSIAIRRGGKQFRDALIAAYEGRCALTDCDAVDALEAAHIEPYNGPATDHVQNGLLLRADVHTLFDLGLIRIDPQRLTVDLAEPLKGTSYAELQGRRLRAPKSPAQRPSDAALRRRFER